MTTTLRKFSGVVAIALCFAAAGCKKNSSEKPPEEKVAISQVPAPVKATIEQQALGGGVKEIEKQTKDGKTFYTASVSLNGNDQKLLIGEDGKFINKQTGGDRDDDD